MVKKIRHYGHNTTAMVMASKKSGIKSLGTVHEQGTVYSTMKP